MRSWRILPALWAVILMPALSSVAQDMQNQPPIPYAPNTSIPLAPPSGTPGVQPPPAADAPIPFRLYAFMARKGDNDAFPAEEDCKPVVSLLKQLPFNVFERINVLDRELMSGSKAEFPINPIYTLNLTMDKSDAPQYALMDIEVQQFRDGQDPIKALITRAQARGGDMLLMRGMPLPPGELVLVLARDPDSNQNQSSEGGQENKEDSQQQQEQQKEQQQDKQQEQNKQDKEDSEKQQEESTEKKQDQDKQEMNADKEGEGESQQDRRMQEGEGEDEGEAEGENAQQETSAEDTVEGESSQDPKNLQAVLESLEETDRREQRDIRNVRDRIDFQGDWW